MSSNTRYGLTNSWDKARQRLAGLEAMADPGTIRHFERLGVEAGSTCLEAGAGGGSMTAWLCDQVGPDGNVVAVDIDTRFVEAIDRPNLTVRQFDITTDDLPTATFDLVHTRAMLTHLADPSAALQSLSTALAPGGWLLAEELDFVGAAPVPGVDQDQSELFSKAVDAHHAALAERADVFYGRRLPDDLGKCDLDEIGSEGRTVIVRGGTLAATAWRLTFEQLTESMLASGMIAEAELAIVQHSLDDPSFAFQSMVFMAAWGRKPAA